MYVPKKSIKAALPGADGKAVDVVLVTANCFVALQRQLLAAATAGGTAAPIDMAMQKGSVAVVQAGNLHVAVGTDKGQGTVKWAIGSRDVAHPCGVGASRIVALVAASKSQQNPPDNHAGMQLAVRSIPGLLLLWEASAVQLGHGFAFIPKAAAPTNGRFHFTDVDDAAWGEQ